MAEASRPTTEDDMKAGQRSSTPMGPQGSTPVPDPTALTTDQLRREITSLNILITTRLDAMDKAVDILRDLANREPTSSVLQERTIALRAEIDQKFQTDSVKFVELDKRTEALTAAGKIAIDAAFKAQQEAASKQEAQFTKQIDQAKDLVQTSLGALSAQIVDVKSRLDRGEGSDKGQAQHAAGINSTTVIVIAFLGMAIAGASFLFNFSKGVGPEVAAAIQKNSDAIGRLLERTPNARN